MENSFREEKGIFNLQVDDFSKSYLLEAARWAKFLSIMGFIGIGFMILGGLFGGMMMTSFSGGSAMGALGGTGILLLYVLIAAIYIYPILALYRFSSNIKPAILSSNQEQFNTALRNLKGMFKFLGIFTIIFLALYVLFIIVIAVVGISM
jgi:hypothetical protein